MTVPTKESMEYFSELVGPQSNFDERLFIDYVQAELHRDIKKFETPPRMMSSGDYHYFTYLPSLYTYVRAFYLPFEPDKDKEWRDRRNRRILERLDCYIIGQGCHYEITNCVLTVRFGKAFETPC